MSSILILHLLEAEQHDPLGITMLKKLKPLNQDLDKSNSLIWNMCSGSVCGTDSYCADNS
jgi:hypothetical protein